MNRFESSGEPDLGIQNFLRDNVVLNLATQLPADTWREGLEARYRFPFQASSFGVGGNQLLPTALMGPIYGQLYDLDQTRHDLPLHVLTCSAEQLTIYHERLQKEVLVDEGGRIPRLTIPPHPDDHDPTANYENNNYWLRCILNGTWPIMQYREPSTGRLMPYSHDQESYHLGNMALYPAEMQGALNRVAAHTLHRRSLGQSTFTILSGEKPEELDPFSYGTNGFARRKAQDGITILDRITDDPRYMELLSCLAVLPEAQRISFFDELCSVVEPHAYEPSYRPSHEGDVVESPVTLHISTYRLVEGLYGQQRAILCAANFSMRMEEGRNLQPHEAKQAIDDHMRGILRVASKLHGSEYALVA